MSKVVNVQVDIRETRGDVAKLIRKFIKKCKKERIVEDYLDRRFYEKPSEKRRRKRIKKKENARKAAAALRNKDSYNKR
jgi:ribosomal protein S21